MFKWYKGLGIGTNKSEASALLQVASTTQGSMPAPRMDTTERDAIASPANSLKIYNTDDNRYEYFDSVEWKPIGAGSVAKNEKIGTGDGVTTVFTMGFAPTDGDSIMVFANVPMENTEWSLLGLNQIQFVTAPVQDVDILVFYLTEGTPIAIPTPTNVENVKYRTITAGEFAAKQLILSALPAVPQNVKVDFIGGPAQEYLIDFTIAGSLMDWNALGLETIILTGSKLRIVYFS